MTFSHLGRWLSLFIFLHVLCWTSMPFLVRYNLPLDAIEGTIWGHQLEWGYDKNPFLNGWLTALAIFLGGPTGWMIYLFSQLSVATCFWAVWRLAKHILNPTFALLSVLILEAIQYYNFHAIDFNDNTLELGLWALTIYSFYLATSKPGSIRHWVLTGLFAGLSLMAKYYTVTLLASMFLFLLANSSNRKQLSTMPPYLGLITCLAVIAPHVMWLFSHEFVTVTYVFARAKSIPSWTNHFFFPAQFAWQQFEALLPAIILFGLLFLGRKPAQDKPLQISTSNKQFLFYVGLGPFLLTLLLSFVCGTNLRAGWGMPLWSLVGIMLFTLAQPSLTKTKLYVFITGIFILMASLLTGYSLSLIRSNSPSSANFPGQIIADTLAQVWQDNYHTKLDYVAGSRWIGGNIGFYSKDHPAVFPEWNTQHAPWINQTDLRKKGAIFVWEITANENLPDNIKQQFPKLSKTSILTFTWRRDSHHLEPIKLGVALLAPDANSAH
jgi:4-amino-4-deoxy-L-arabinose transferase-like glycosyltransferase